MAVDPDKLLAQALTLAPEARAALAAALLDSLAEGEGAGAEAAWAATLAGSQSALARLADEARTEHRAGRTKPLDPDAL